VLEPPRTAARERVERTESGQVWEATGHFPLFDPLGSGIDPFRLAVSLSNPVLELLREREKFRELSSALSQVQEIQSLDSAIQE